MNTENLFEGIPNDLPEELFTTLHQANGLTIERIVSQGHASPPGFWYDQDKSEWVIVLKGNAVVQFEGDPEPVELQPGSYLNIPAHKRHRVMATSLTEKTVWLAACWDNGPNHIFPYLAERSEFCRLEPGIPIVLNDLTITPFAVDHGPKAPGALGFVAQHHDRKIIFTGDFLHVVDEDNPLLSNADVAFMDANTWHPADRTAHQSVLGDLRLIEHWKPKRTYLVHYSGYEDRNQGGNTIDGPMRSDRLCEELQRLPGRHDDISACMARNDSRR